MKNKGFYAKMNNFDDLEDIDKEPEKKDNVANAFFAQMDDNDSLEDLESKPTKKDKVTNKFGS